MWWFIWLLKIKKVKVSYRSINSHVAVGIIWLPESFVIVHTQLTSKDSCTHVLQIKIFLNYRRPSTSNDHKFSIRKSRRKRSPRVRQFFSIYHVNAFPKSTFKYYKTCITYAISLSNHKTRPTESMRGNYICHRISNMWCYHSNYNSNRYCTIPLQNFVIIAQSNHLHTTPYSRPFTGCLVNVHTCSLLSCTRRVDAMFRIIHFRIVELVFTNFEPYKTRKPWIIGKYSDCHKNQVTVRNW